MVAVAAVRQLMRDGIAGKGLVLCHLRREIDRRTQEPEEAGRLQPGGGVDRQRCIHIDNLPTAAERARKAQIDKDEPQRDRSRAGKPYDANDLRPPDRNGKRSAHRLVSNHRFDYFPLPAVRLPGDRHGLVLGHVSVVGVHALEFANLVQRRFQIAVLHACADLLERAGDTDAGLTDTEGQKQPEQHQRPQSIARPCAELAAKQKTQDQRNEDQDRRRDLPDDHLSPTSALFRIS